MNPTFWKGKRVLLTGHTGFKGAWAALLLNELGARVTGFALPPESQPNLWTSLSGSVGVIDLRGDIRDSGATRRAIEDCAPEIVIHMAAQALVRRSYRDPIETFSSNVTGTAIVLEALRDCPAVRVALVVTSDKVYANNEDGRPFRETEPLGGDDPYSASKAACELVVASFRKSYFAPQKVSLVTARAGNVIGGGDWSEDRLIPDMVRAALAGNKVSLRYPDATRPWQHVLDSLGGYIRYIEALAEQPYGSLSTALNFGPDLPEGFSVSEIANLFASRMPGFAGWMRSEGEHPPEKMALGLANNLARDSIGWRPTLSADQALDWTVDWYSEHAKGLDPAVLCRNQIDRFCALKAARDD